MIHSKEYRKTRQGLIDKWEAIRGDAVTYGIDLTNAPALNVISGYVPHDWEWVPSMEDRVKWRRTEDKDPSDPVDAIVFDFIGQNWFGKHYHEVDETITIVHGQMNFYLLLDDKVEVTYLTRGDSLDIPANTPHDGFAITNCIVMADFCPPLRVASIPHQEEDPVETPSADG